MKFKQTYKDYQYEEYTLPVVWKNKNIKIVVGMKYHTFLKYWESNGWAEYGDGFITKGFNITNFEMKLNRKDTRAECAKLMVKIEEDPMAVIENLDDFYKNLILEEAK